MTIAEQIKAVIKAEYNEGMTQQEIAARHCITQAYIQRLLSGQRECEGLSLRVVSRMFPRATLNINGDTVVAENSGINNGVMGINHGTVHADSSAAVEKFRAELISEIIMLDEQVTKDQILKTIAAHGKGK